MVLSPASPAPLLHLSVHAWWPGRCNTTAGGIFFSSFFAEFSVEMYESFEAHQHRSANCNTWRIVAVASQPPKLHSRLLCDETCLSLVLHLPFSSTKLQQCIPFDELFSMNTNLGFLWTLKRTRRPAVNLQCQSLLFPILCFTCCLYVVPYCFSLLLHTYINTQMIYGDALPTHNTHIVIQFWKDPHNIQLIHNRKLFSADLSLPISPLLGLILA